MLVQDARLEDRGKYDASCDVYSLAITLAEALSVRVNSVDGKLETQRPYSDLYDPENDKVERFIIDEIKTKVYY